MNNLIDIANKWANRLVIRILIMSGVSQESINRVIEAMNNRQTILSQSDKKLKGRFQWLKWFIITVLVAACIYIALNFKTITKKLFKK